MDSRVVLFRIVLLVLVLVLVLVAAAALVIMFLKKGVKIAESFTGKNDWWWSRDDLKKFIEYKQSVYPNTVINLKILQQDASPSEFHTMLKDGGLWPWEDQTVRLVKEALQKNTMLEIDPDEGVLLNRKLYNNQTMKRKLAYNTPEGQFLLFGSKAGKQGLVSCVDGTPRFRRSAYEYGDGSVISDYSKIPDLVSGFSFSSSPCNPCQNLDNIMVQKCAFRMADPPSYTPTVATTLAD